MHLYRMLFAKSLNLRMRFFLLSGILWLLSLCNLQAQTWTVYDTANSGLTHNGVTRLQQDSSGQVWIGTLGGGLNSFDGSFWGLQSSSNSFIPGDSIFALARDKQGFLWAGTEGGLGWRFGLGIWNVYDTNNSPLPENRIRSVFADPAGDIWAGTSMGIAWLDNPTWTLFNRTNSGMRGDLHHGINTVDKDGRLWAVTRDGGIGIYDSGVWSNYDTGNSGLPVNDIQVAFQDFFGDIWIGTHGGGLVQFERLLWNVIDTNNSAIPGMHITCIKEELPGRLWIGFAGQGLALFENGNWTHYTAANSGLPNDSVNDILIEKGERIWVATNHGLAVSQTIISVEEARQNKVQLQLFPNPAHEEAHLLIHAARPYQGHLEIRNALGQVLQKRWLKAPQGRREISLNTANLSPGVYFIRWGEAVLRFVKN